MRTLPWHGSEPNPLAGGGLRCVVAVLAAASILGALGDLRADQRGEDGERERRRIHSAGASSRGVGGGAPDGDTASRRRAKVAFDQATRAFARAEYEEALESFRAAYAARPHPAILFNAAVCLERLGRSQEAVLAYERLLDGPGADALAADHRARALEALGRLGEAAPPEPEPAPEPEAQPEPEPAPEPPELDLALHPGVTAAPRVTAPAVLRVRRPLPARAPRLEHSSWTHHARWIGLGAFTVLSIATVATAIVTRSMSDQYGRTGDPATLDRGLLLRDVTQFVLLPAALAAGAVTVVAFLLHEPEGP